MADSCSVSLIILSVSNYSRGVYFDDFSKVRQTKWHDKHSNVPLRAARDAAALGKGTIFPVPLTSCNACIISRCQQRGPRRPLLLAALNRLWPWQPYARGNTSYEPPGCRSCSWKSSLVLQVCFFNIIYLLYPCLPRGLLLSYFPTKTLHALVFLRIICNISCPSHPPWFYHAYALYHR
jgi:hypothetical protein